MRRLIEPRVRGFTVIEALIALVILSAVLMALAEGLIGGTRGIVAAEAERRALELARYELAKVGVETPLTAGRREGSAPGGLSFVIDVVPREAGGSAPRASALRAYQVSVDVAWRDSDRPVLRHVRLETMKLGSVP